MLTQRTLQQTTILSFSAMKIYDITRSLDNLNVYSGDPKPQYSRISDIAKGAEYNITKLDFCLHNSTHIDAPKHVFQNGLAVSDMPIETFVGECFVLDISYGDYMKRISHSCKRILIKGNTAIDIKLATALCELGVCLIGTELATVGAQDDIDILAVHKQLLQDNIAILENIDLSEVPEGAYFLSTAPIKVVDSEAAPARALLIEMEE